MPARLADFIVGLVLAMMAGVFFAVAADGLGEWIALGMAWVCWRASDEFF